MADLKEKIQNLQKQFETDLKSAKLSGNFDELYLKYFSKTHGIVTLLLRELPSMNADEKRMYGPELNNLQNEYKSVINASKNQYEQDKVNDPAIDLTLPAQPQKSGYLHPTTQVIREMNEFFRYYGFSIVEGPEIENVEYNFRKLNLPENHPATDLQDTLFIEQPDILLRTHTSSVESRLLTDYKPPIRAVTPGKVFRNETANKSNSSFFYQYQGVIVDKGITLKNLKGTFNLFLKFMYGEDTVIRYRYKYYPEVSPGLGTDIQCPFCKGAGCDTCKQRGWIEVLGSGMIHFNTLKMCGIDPEEYTGFAFGMGLDRLVMAKFGITDIRKLYGGGMVYRN